MQSFDYFQKFVKDSVWLKSLVRKFIILATDPDAEGIIQVGFLWYAYRKPLSTYLYFRQGPGYSPARADRTCIVLLGYHQLRQPQGPRGVGLVSFHNIETMVLLTDLCRSFNVRLKIYTLNDA
jgi:hypothetical protein